MASRRRPTHEQRRDPCTYVEVVVPAFNPNRVLLRRFFLNYDKSKYVSVGFYPAQNYQPLVQFGGTRILPLVVPTEYVTILAERLPGFVEAMRRNEQFQ